VGGWVPALAGDSASDDVRRRYEDEIEAGRILLVVDALPEMHAEVHGELGRHGASLLDADEET
jgi:hypothetical protein